jgi:hypothetical protein
MSTHHHLIRGLIAFAAFLAPTRSWAQSPTPQPGTLPLAIAIAPPYSDEATASMVDPVMDAIVASMPGAGLAAIARAPLQLKVNLLARAAGQSDAGMRRILRGEVSVSLTLQSPSSAGTLGSVRLVRVGTGRDLEAATAQALAQLTDDGDALLSALQQLGQQAVSAFEGSCDAVVASARDHAASREFDESLAILMSVPSSASRCRTRATALAQQVYSQRSQWQCGTALQQASAAQAAGRLGEALEQLRFVDPLSPCQARVSALISAIGAQAAARRAQQEAARAEELRREWEFRKDVLQAASSIERQRLIVIGKIAEAALAPGRR